MDSKEVPTTDFNVFAGSEIGVVKGINFNQKSVITKNFGHGNLKVNDLQVACMAWNNSNNEEQIIVGFQNQTVKILDTSCNSFTSSRCVVSGKGPLVSVLKAPDGMVTGLESGEVSIWKGTTCTTIHTITNDEYSDRNMYKPTLSCVIANPSQKNILATGGCENDLALWDINDISKPLFKAKNVKSDMLDLRVPIWISDMTYLPNSNQIGLCSRHKHIRLYDAQVQRKPIISFEWEDFALTSIAAIPSSDKQIIIGSGAGKMAMFDLRKVTSNKPLCVYKNLVGSITDIVVHPSQPLIFSVSLDRFIRVHHLHSREIIYKHFLKSRINCLLVRKEINLENFHLDDEPIIQETEKIIVPSAKRRRH